MNLNYIHRFYRGVAASLLLSMGVVYAVDTYDLEIAAQPLPQALKQFAEQSDLQIVYYSAIAEGMVSKEVVGNLTADAALTKLLASTHLTFNTVDKHTVAITAKKRTGGDKDTGNYQPTSNKILVAQAETSAKKSGTTIASTQRRTGKTDTARGLIEEIIVTAQKRQQRLIDVPISIVAMDASEIMERGIENFVDLGLAVPGLAVVDAGAGLRYIYMRGLGNINGTAMVGVYMDEIPVTSASYLQPDLRAFDLERVEVLRGPQGTLYGQGSMGGNIRFITKQPELDNFALKGNVSTGFTKDGASSQRIQSAVNVPLIEDELGIRITGTYENAGGWIDQPAVSQKNINDQNVVNVRIKGLWQPSEALKVNTMAMIHRNDSGAPPQSEDEDGNFTQVFGLSTTPKFGDDYEIYNLTFTYGFDSVQFISSSSYMNVDKPAVNNGQRIPFAPPPVPILEAYDPTPFFQDAEVFSQEVRLSSTGEGALQWTIGAFYRDSEDVLTTEGQFSCFCSVLPAATGPSFVFDSNYDSWAVFGDASYVLTERFEVGVGLRYFEEDQELISGFGGVNTTQSGKFDSLTPRFYASFDVSEGIKTYASAAKGFRSGGFNTLGQPEYEPDEVWSYELGTKMSLMDGRLAAELAVYYSEYKDLQIRGILPPPAPIVAITSNAGDAEIVGVDWGLTYQATENFQLAFSGSYVDTELVKVDATSTSHIIGDRLDFVPEYKYTLSGAYDFVWQGKPGFARLDYNQQGRSVHRNRSFGPHYQSASDVINMLNFNMQLQWNDNLSLGIYANNLLNDRQFLDPYSVRFWAARSRPRTIGFEFGVDFN